MSNDVIIGHDGKPRCAWIGADDDKAIARYHDEVWGARTLPDERPAPVRGPDPGRVRGWAELGDRVQEARRVPQRIPRLFDVAKVAAMTGRDVDRLVEDSSIIRNRSKIQATIDNARAMRTASPNLAELAKSYAVTRKRAPRSIAELPSSTPQSETFAKQLKSQGYRFVGPTSVYAFMQNVGIVNDHVHGCLRAADYPASGRSRARA